MQLVSHQGERHLDKPNGNKSEGPWRMEASNWSRCCKSIQDMDCMKELSCQSLDGRKSCYWKNSEPLFRNTDKIIQGNPCIKKLENMKVNVSINMMKEDDRKNQEQAIIQRPC